MIIDVIFQCGHNVFPHASAGVVEPDGLTPRKVCFEIEARVLFSFIIKTLLVTLRTRGADRDAYLCHTRSTCIWTRARRSPCAYKETVEWASFCKKKKTKVKLKFFAFLHRNGNQYSIFSNF